MSAATVIPWSHAGTDAVLPESIDSDTVRAATRDAVRLLELERIGLRPPRDPHQPSLDEIAHFATLVDRRGGPTACHLHAHANVMFAGKRWGVRYVAWYIAEGYWPPHQVRASCGSGLCCNRAHLIEVNQAKEPGAIALPPDEVARFLGISQRELDTLCRRILTRKTITPKALDLLVQAHTALGGTLP